MSLLEALNFGNQSLHETSNLGNQSLPEAPNLGYLSLHGAPDLKYLSLHWSKDDINLHRGAEICVCMRRQTWKIFAREAEHGKSVFA